MWLAGDFVEWEGGAGSGPAISPIEQEVMADTVGSAKNEKNGDDGNKEVKDNSKKGGEDFAWWGRARAW